MPTYKNVGDSPWRRSSGEAVPPGGYFVATPREHSRILRRSYLQQRLVLVPDEPVTQEQKPPQTDVPKLLREEKPTSEWPLVMKPSTYVALHPKGQYARLARRILKAAKKKKE